MHRQSNLFALVNSLAYVWCRILMLIFNRSMRNQQGGKDIHMAGIKTAFSKVELLGWPPVEHFYEIIFIYYTLSLGNSDRNALTSWTFKLGI